MTVLPIGRGCPRINYRYVLRITAISLLLLPAAMVPISAWCAVDHAPSQIAALESFTLTILTAGLLIAMALIWLRRTDTHFGRHEAFLMVGLTWVLAPAIAGLPFLLWARVFSGVSTHPFNSPLNCYFEAISGLTTTGSSILSDIESVPPGLLLWRSTTHWLGGLGIVLLFVALLPMVGATSRKLHSVESTGPSRNGSHPRVRDTARTLWLSYTAITLGSILALRVAGLPWFNAICETFGAIATGGYSVRNSSIAGYGSWAVDVIIIVVMTLGAVNFALYYELARRRWRTVICDPELRWMLLLFTGSSLIVGLSILGGPINTLTGRHIHADWMAALRYGTFNLVSMHTDSGFATADFDLWPFIALVVIAFGTFVGGSAGSTTGGIKVVRLYGAIKILFHQLRIFIKPDLIRPVRIGNQVLSRDEQLAVIITILCFLLALAGGTFLLMLFGSATVNVDLKTAFSASLANLCTAGPGFGAVGPTQNYVWLPGSSKVVLCVLMLIGRLEIVPILALLHYRFWLPD